jgi:hypothetical protein
MTEMTPEQAAAAEKMAEALHHQEMNEIVSLGRTEYGSEAFDDASQTVASKLGERALPVTAALRQFDFPHRIVQHLADNPNDLEAISKLPINRMLVELARIESRMAPNGRVNTFADPMWKSPTLKGRVSDADWNRGAGDAMSEAAFSKEFDRRMAERYERKRARGWG